MHLEESVPRLREPVSLAAVSWDTEPAATQLGTFLQCVCVCVCVCVRACLCVSDFLSCGFLVRGTCFAVCSCLFLGGNDDNGVASASISQSYYSANAPGQSRADTLVSQ